MAVLQAPGDGGTMIDVLDRVLDKGIVIDGWARLSLAGIDLIGLEMKVVVASIETYLRYSDVIGVSRREEGRLTIRPH
ncbi:MAG: gas vesicle protein GvpA [Chloroflexi bacterium]|nr:MAG: gas vesicle protein GvpA [Chloroflexota bacterium]TMF54269.1 MAG: gas vesicle protein GvpA [Chloroflexota bacterium]